MQRVDSATGWLTRARKALLMCGIASSLLHGVMIWVIRYNGYSPISQTVSELSARGISTRPLWLMLGMVWEIRQVAAAVQDPRHTRHTDPVLHAV
jgi:hypothetical protein